MQSFLARSLGLYALRLIALAWLVLPSAGWTQDHVLGKAYWTDRTATASFEQARSADYTPYSEVLSKGYGNQAQWVRLKIESVTADVSPSLVLRIRPIFLDEITLFDPEDKGDRLQHTTGDWTPRKSSEFESLSHTLLIPTRTESRYVWLRLVTTSTQFMEVEALLPEEMRRQEQQLALRHAVLLLLIFTFLIWVLVEWLRDLDTVNGIFILRQLVMLIYTASYFGYHRILFDELLTPRSIDILYNWLTLLTTALILIFEYRFLQEYLLPHWGHVIFRILILASASTMLLMLGGKTFQALNANMLINAFGILSFVLVALFIRDDSNRTLLIPKYLLPKPTVVTYYLLIFTAMAVSILSNLGLISGTLFSLYVQTLYAVVSGAMMATLLIVRSRYSAKLRSESALNFRLTQVQLSGEKLRRQEQTQLLTMLMHELKTPLSVIEMAIATQNRKNDSDDYINRAVDNMKGVLDRCIQTDRMIEGDLNIQLEHIGLSQQLRSWVINLAEREERFDLEIEENCNLSSDLVCLQVVISNLIGNAVKHGDPGFPIRISLSSNSHLDGRSGISVTVANRPGTSGWPDPDNVFKKYYRSNGAQKVSGTGLGLYLAHSLAIHLGGDIQYLPGSEIIRFKLWLPT